MVKDTSRWLVEIGYNHKTEYEYFTGTQKQLDRYIMKQYKKKAEYVVVELAENIDILNKL